jgi:hypothetical protein
MQIVKATSCASGEGILTEPTTIALATFLHSPPNAQHAVPEHIPLPNSMRTDCNDNTSMQATTHNQTARQYDGERGRERERERERKGEGERESKH